MATILNVLDESTRPKAPPIPGVTEAQRAKGRHLAVIHRFHLQQMRRVRQAMEEIERSGGPAGGLTAAVGQLDMLRNYRAFGNLCGEECQILTFHHTAEDRQMFPYLKGHSDGLDRVIERLQAEHEIVHDRLVKLEKAANNAAAMPCSASFADLKAAYETLEAFVVSHFGYEQAELEEALGVHEVPI